LRVFFAHERADRLGRILKAGSLASTSVWVTIVATGLVDAHVEEVVLQALLQRVADGPLRVRAADVERHFVQLVGGQFAAAQDEADLRAVAVGDGDVPAVLDHLGDVAGGLVGRVVLVFDRLVLLVLISELPPMAMTASFWVMGVFSVWK
jgi:hypothetical protein